MRGHVLQWNVVAALFALSVLAHLESNATAQEAAKRKLPQWFTDSDVVFVADTNNGLLIVTEILKATKYYRLTDLDPTSPSFNANEVNKSKSVLILVSLPSSIDAESQSHGHIRLVNVVNDSVRIDGEIYSLRDIRIALTLRQIGK